MIEAMADLETWGIRTTSVVRSVGIVLFEGRNVLEKHYFRIDEDHQLEQCHRSDDLTYAPRTKDKSTIDWWAKPENATANATIDQAPLVTWSEGRSICGKIGDKVGRIWAKPAMFDLPMLRDLFGQDIWRYGKEADLATLLSEFDPTRSTKPPFVGVQHNALDDAMHAHTWLCDLRDRLPTLIERNTSGKKIWSCKIGECSEDEVGGLYQAPDSPMRDAVTAAYMAVTGTRPKFLFSGWGGALTEIERDVAENRK